MKDFIEILPVKSQWNLQRNILSNFIKNYFLKNKKNKLNILDAGCGQYWNLDLSGIDYMSTGIDISKEALELRKNGYGYLDKIIIGDLETIELKSSEYDIIYCSYLLEHLNNAEDVLNKFFKWLKPNGLLVLIIPDRNTAKGFVTRFAPFGLHIFYAKYFGKNVNAGQPGHGPFPTPFNKIVSRQGIHDYCRRHDYRIIIEYGQRMMHKRPIFSPLFFIIFTLIKLISVGKLASNYTDLIYVIEKS